MTLEVRNKEGACIADFTEKLAYAYYQAFMESPSVFKRITKKVKGKPAFEAFEVLSDQKIQMDTERTLGGKVVIWLFKGSYIKILV